MSMKITHARRVSLRIACLIFLAATLGWAQNAQLTGFVKDRSNAVIPHASVTIRNVDTGGQLKTLTSSDGLYTMPEIKPGRYDVTVQATGFRTVSQTGLKLDVDQKVNLDFTLDVGSVTENVVVTADTAILQTSTASLGQVIPERSVVGLPLNGRNFTQLATLTPGVSMSSTTTNTNGYTLTANGMRTTNVVFMVNGINVTDGDFEGTPILPPPDAIQEFKMETNSLEAQYGLGGAVVNVELKSGSNSIHGSTYEFLRNNSLDGRNFFALKREALKQNQFGGTISGPIVKNRTFIFGDYQGTRIRSGNTFNDVVPSAAIRSGDFSSLSGRVVDPLSGNPFPGNRIPTSSFSPQATYFLKYYPLPNTPQGNYVWNAASSNDANQFDIRVDHQISTSDSLNASYFFTKASLYSPGSLPDNGALFKNYQNQLAAINEVHTFSPHIVNQLSAGYIRMTEFVTPGAHPNYTVDSGIGGFDVTSSVYPGFPALSPTGYTGITDNAYYPLHFRENNYNVRDIATITKGKHLIQLGFEGTGHSNFTTNAARSRGEFTFTGVYSGNSFADLLLGYPYNGARTFPRDLFGYYMVEQEAFVQDTWKLAPRFTITAGLRYSLIHQPTAMHNVISSVDVYNNKIIVGSDSQGNFQIGAQDVAQYVFPLFSNIIVPSSKAGLDNSLRYPNNKNFAPRLGIAWQPRDGIVVRAGYGIMYTLYQGNQFEGTVAGANLPYFADQNNIYNTTPTPTKTLANYFPTISLGNFNLPPLSFYTMDPHAPTPYLQQWNLTIQKTIAGLFSLETAYVGNKGTHLPFDLGQNIPLPGPGVIQDRRPNTVFSSGDRLQNTDSSVYDALQIKVETKSWHGLNFLSTYAWSKGLDYQNTDTQSSTVQDPNNIAAERGLTADPASVFTLGGVYELPFFKNRRGLTSLALGGWGIGSIVNIRSGLAFTPTIHTDPANTGSSKRPNRIGDGGLAHPTVDEWFDLSAFQVPAAYTYGNSGVNILRGPGSANLDLSLFKTFRVTERFSLQFRAESFNLTNTAHFANPTTDIQSASAGKILSASAPRQIQLALKLAF